MSASSTLVILARHGQTALNADGRLRGHLDPPLDETGLSEVYRLGAALEQQLTSGPPTQIVSSPLGRAVQTAHAIRECVGGTVVTDERFLDRDYGRWAGEVKDDVIAEFGSLDLAPGVEPAESVVRRVRAAMDEHAGVCLGGLLVVVGHDAVNSLLLASLDPQLGEADEITQATACWNRLRHDASGWAVELVDQHP